MKPEEPSGGGLLHSLQGLADRVLLSAQDRIALFAVEVEEESARLVRILIWAGALVLSGLMTLLMASFMLVWLAGEGRRTLVLVSLTLSYLGVFVVLCLRFRRFLANQPRPFEASLTELDSDRQCLHTRK